MNTKTSPKDFFLHLAATVFLYAAVVALINLGFEVASRALPDALQTFYDVGSIVWPISTLIVLVPVTYVIEWLINRDIAKMPEKKDIWIRRWRIYLTLFLTAISIVVDLIVLINTYLDGEITGRFIYKVVIIIVVSGVVFAYYLLAKAGKPGRAKAWRTVLMWFGIVLTLAAIVSGFMIVGSPATQRAMRFDGVRINDLVLIQSAVISYRQIAGKLPDSLANLSNGPAIFPINSDPATNQPYEYRRTGQDAYELCATFSTASPEYGYRPVGMPQGIILNQGNNIWIHGAGRYCFERMIGPSLGPPIKPSPSVPEAPAVPAMPAKGI